MGGNLRRRDFLKAAGICVVGAGFAGCEEQARKGQSVAVAERPNILWITCEDICPYLGCYGDKFAITPHLDALAKESVLYEKAFSTGPVCSPSRSCLVTGVYATTMGTQHLRSLVKLPEKIKCFPKILREAGYYCSNNYKKDYNFVDVGVWDESSHDAHWRNRAAGQPFFSVFNFESTHQGQINGTDEEFFQKYRSKLDVSERHDPAKVTLPPFYPDTPMVRDIMARYYDLITFMDKQVRRLLDELDADGLAKNTIVFFFSDHGMGLPRFKRTLYDTGLHVPLLIRLPEKYRGMSQYRAGSRTDRLVSFVDFAPTVLSVLGLEIPDYMQGKPFMGAARVKPRRYIYGAASRVDEAYEVMRCVRDQRYKYIRNFMPQLPYIQPSEYPDRAEIMKELRRVAAQGQLKGAAKAMWRPTKPREELYDTQNDPYEIADLAGDPKYRQVQQRLSSELRSWILRTRDTGMMQEAEMHIRAAGSTIYDVAQSPQKYPLELVLEAANLVGLDESKSAKMIEMAHDKDAAVRYWAVLALSLLYRKDLKVMATLTAALNDSSPNVRFTAAGALCKMGKTDQALKVLGAGLDEPRGETVLAAAREIESIGALARPLLDKIKQTRAKCFDAQGKYKDDRHSMFVDWALKYAEANCEPAVK